MRSHQPGTANEKGPSFIPAPIDQIARALNQVDSGLSALIELLQSSDKMVSAGGIAALMRPHADMLKRASAALNDAA